VDTRDREEVGGGEDEEDMDAGGREGPMGSRRRGGKEVRGRGIGRGEGKGLG